MSKQGIFRSNRINYLVAFIMLSNRKEGLNVIVEITMEKVQRVAKEYDVTEDQMQELIMGINPFREDMEQKMESGVCEYDYTVNDDSGQILVDWS